MSVSPLSPDEQEALKRTAAEAALAYVRDGDVVGLGTGSTVRHFLLALEERVRSGMRVQGVPTSQETATLAMQLGIPLLSSEQEWAIDVAVDGADQVDPQLNLIKGGGGALLREKIVAAAAHRFIVIVDAAKRVPVLGHPFPLPVEVIPFGWPNTSRMIKALGGEVTIRQRNGEIFRTDGGHFILDLKIDRIEDPAELEIRLNRIPGVVENGLFTGRTSILIVGTSQGIEIQQGSEA